MITALDSTLLFDLFLDDRKHGQRAAELIHRCRDRGHLVVCELVWAEVGALFASSAKARDALLRLGIELTSIDATAAARAADAWRRQKRSSRRLSVARFLVGAHALGHADRLATRDRAFYRKHYPGLKLTLP